MIKELREALEISLNELSFVLDVDVDQIAEWEKSNNIPEEIMKKLQKRYSKYFGKNDQGNQYFKKKDNGFKNNGKKTKLDKLFESQKNSVRKPVKSSKKHPKIILKKKKNNNETSKVKIKDTNGKEKIKTVSVKTKKINGKTSKDDVDIPADYLKSLIKNNNLSKKETDFSSLRDIRKYLKISQSELGEKLDINQRKISIWEITNAKLPKEIIEKISDTFNIPINDINHLIESDETTFLLENLPFTKSSFLFDNEIDSLDIQAVRKAFGHSLRTFAQEIGVHYQTVARWEKGNGMPKDYILKVIIDKFLNRISIKKLIDEGYDVSLKEEYAHWKNEMTEEEKEALQNINEVEVKDILDKKLEVLSMMESEGLEIDSITINSGKSITIKNSINNFQATIILTEEVKNSLKSLFDK